MDEKSTYYEDLLTRYFLGETTPEEITGLSEWLSSNPLNMKLFDEYRQTWLLTVKDNITSNTDIDKEWKDLEEKLKHSSTSGYPAPAIRKKQGIFPLSTTWKVAAALLVLAVIAATLIYTSLSPKMVEVYAEEGNLEQVLPDGSVVMLYRGSTIEYPVEFVNKERRITLEGVAFFNVTHDPSHPFVVAGNNVRIKVLGTTFQVNTIEDDKMVSVVLATGSVSVYFRNRESEQLILNPGEMALISTDNKTMQKSANSNPNFNAWLTGTITFNNTGLREVIATLEEVYQTKIVIENEESANCTLTATFNRQSFEEVMQVISTTLDLQITTSNNVTYINGACN